MSGTASTLRTPLRPAYQVTPLISPHRRIGIRRLSTAPAIPSCASKGSRITSSASERQSWRSSRRSSAERRKTATVWVRRAHSATSRALPTASSTSFTAAVTHCSLSTGSSSPAWSPRRYCLARSATCLRRARSARVPEAFSSARCASPTNR